MTQNKKVDKDTPIGTEVYLIENDNIVTKTRTRSVVWALGHGELVALVDGKTGGWAIERMTIVPNDDRAYVTKEQAAAQIARNSPKTNSTVRYECKDGITLTRTETEMEPKVFEPIALTTDSDIWDKVRKWKKANKNLSRKAKPPYICFQCGIRTVYIDKYDRHACLDCMTWTEEGCGCSDAQCPFPKSPDKLTQEIVNEYRMIQALK